MAGPFTTPVAQSTPMENRDVKDNDFKSLNVQDGMEEIDFRRETKDPTGFLDIEEMTCSFNNPTRTFNVAPVLPLVEFTYYIQGCKFKGVTDSIQIPDVSGVYFFYYDTNETLTYTYEDHNNYIDYVRAGAVYWNSTIQVATWFGDVRSNLSMSWADKRRTHFINRVEFADSDFIIHDYIDGGDGSLDSHTQVSVKPGMLYHEDIRRQVVDSATPTLPFEQKLLNIAEIPILYKLGSEIYKKTANTFPLKEGGAGLTIEYNEETSPGVWGLTNAPNNTFVAIYLFTTMDPNNPVVGFLGNLAASSPAGALDPDFLTPTGTAFGSFGFMKSLIFQTSQSFTNAVHARLFAVTDVLDTLSADRYVIDAQYGGNANTGRWLEISNNESSDDQPVYIPEDSIIRTITLQATSNIGNGKSIGFYNSSISSTTPAFIVTVPFGGSKNHTWEVTESFLKASTVAVKVVNGSIQKPVVRFWIETNI